LKTKQVIVVRKDLNMRKGKLAAQVAHASMKVLLDCMKVDNFPVIRYTERRLMIHWDKPLEKWLSGSFTKIVVSCDSEKV
jgi:PTH2 family peptidyl-tRNA hydrolase